METADVANYCSQGHPNPDGDSFQRNCRECGEDMFSASLLANPAPAPTVPMAPGYQAVAARPVSMAFYGEDIRRSRSAATWSLVLGILGIVLCGFFTGIPAIVMGNKSRRLSPPGFPNGIAIAGITLGWISVALGIVGFLVALSTFSSASP